MAITGWMATLLMIAQWLAGLFVLALIFGVIAVIFMYIQDKRQTQHTIRRNFPRYWAISLLV